MNLDNGIVVAKAPFTTMLGATRHGIYKVIIYAKTSTESIAGWQVKVKDTSAQKSETQSNELNAVTPCTSGDPASSATDTFPFLCEANLAATEVIVQSASATADLAEIVVVGFTWDEYPCGKGYFSTDGTHSDTGGQDCKECTNGQYQGEFSATNKPTACTACENTEQKVYFTNTLVHKQATACEVCPVPDVAKSDASGCEKCPAGQEYKAVGSSEGGCTYPTDLSSKRANPGDVVENTTPESCTTVSCAACPDGTRNPVDSTKYCYQCPDGEVPNSGKEGCEECVAGKYMNPARTDCVDCEDGKISTAGQDQCTVCAGGEYTADHVTCTPCPVGEQPNAARDACEKCDAGTKKADGETTCTDCAAGSKSDVGASVCTPCEVGTIEQDNSCVQCTAAGKYQDETGQTTCKDCDAGKVPNDDNSGCVPCSKGEKEETDVCVACPTGKYQDVTGQTTCKDCDAGKVPNGEKDACNPCPIGTKEESFVCVDCAKGEHQDGTGETACKPCLSGYVSTAVKQENCVPCAAGQEANAGKTACEDCEAGKYQEVEGGAACLDCAEGHYSANVKTATCTPCETGQYQGDKGQESCTQCSVGQYQGETGQAACTSCNPGHISKNKGQSACTPCFKGQEANAGKTACEDCYAGKYQEVEGGPACLDCAVGHYSASVKTATCTPCETGRYQGAKGKTDCVDCGKGTFAAKEGSTVCDACEDGHVARALAQASCTACQPGEKSNEQKTDCVLCDKGYYQDGTGQGDCLQCPYNTFSQSAGTVECTTCATDHYAMPGSESCTKCPDGNPDHIRTAMADKDEQLKEKCLSDLGEGCFRREISNQYGTFTLEWLKVDESKSLDCGYDDNAPQYKAEFTCTKTKDDKLTISEAYTCKNTAHTEKIEQLTDPSVPVEDKTRQMEELTENVNSNGLGDVEAVADVLATITEDKDNPGKEVVIEPAVTASILNTISNLVVSDLKVASSEEQAKSASKISNNMLKQILKVAQTTSVKNKPVTSKNVAVIDVRQAEDAPNKMSGILSFTLPKGDQSNKDLNQMTVGSGSDDDKDSTILLIETKAGDESTAVDMAIVLITDSTLMPDTTISITPASEAGDAGTVQNIIEDLQLDLQRDGDGDQRTYINSFITEVKVENAPDNFKLNLFMKPSVDIGGNNDSLKTKGDGQRLQVIYICAKYDPEEAKWRKSCDTIYDSANPSLGVLCLCTHNTSFAVLMSAYEVDRGYAEVQSYLTYVLLGLSTAGLVLTLLFLIPAKALRSTRSAKINICFSTALLLASLVFLVQDAFINAEDTGLIKLKSTGCVVYAMLQHYLWLVVFVWMVVEGFLMYLSLVQVFGSHISKYMLKFNLAAWAIPLPFPFIGYYVFTKKYSIGSFTFTKHDYLADTMCFVKPESIAFYTLFLTPIILVILVNLVFFALVAKVIKNSKSSGNVSDQEQILRQLKAAVGVMVLLGTGWFFGIFMSVPAPQFQVGMQYLFILLNSSQGFFVFLFYIVLNDQVKTHWLVKVGFRDDKRPTTSSSAAGKSSAVATKATVVSTSANHDNIYENANAMNDEEHTYASAEYASAGDKAGKHEFPAKSDNNANI